MRTQVLFIAALALSCCKTVRKTPSPGPADQGAAPTQNQALADSEGSPVEQGKTADASAVATSSELLLKKVVGALSKEDPKAQHYECVVTSADVAQADQVKKWIGEVAKAPIVEAYHFRATVPSIQIFAYNEGQEILVFESYSMAKYRRPTDENAIKNETAEELMKIANQKCTYP